MKLLKYASLSLALFGHGALALSREDFAVHHGSAGGFDRHLLGGHTSAAPAAAPERAWKPEEGAPYEPHGMGVYHYRAHDIALHHKCEVTDENGFCLDFKESRGSCYYAGSDPHIGHAIYCDVSEVECCGYEGCSVKPQRGHEPDGETKHDYYWYAPGYMSEDRSSGKNLCCHCYAGCALDTEGPENVFDRSDPPNKIGICTYYDVSHKDCQRTDTGSDARVDEKESYSDDPKMIGFLRCPLPGAVMDGAHPPANLGEPMIRSQSAATAAKTPAADDTPAADTPAPTPPPAAVATVVASDSAASTQSVSIIAIACALAAMTRA